MQQADGHTDDILFRGAEGEVALWSVHDDVPITPSVVGTRDAGHWSIAGFIGDAAAPGREEVLWRGTAGETELSVIMNGVLAPALSLGIRDPAVWSVGELHRHCPQWRGRDRLA